MTWKEFESELKNIHGVNVQHESDALGNFLIVYIGKTKTDYFLISHINNPDRYMSHHYFLLVRMLAACM